MSKTLEELEVLIIEWAKARKIIPNASPETQLMKTYSEVGEMADAIIKNDLAEIKDAIGDIFVTLVIWNKLKWDFPFPDEIYMTLICENNNITFSEFASDLNKLFVASIQNYKRSTGYYVMMDYLSSYAQHYGLTLEECVESAYNEISPRTGTLLPNGVFVKD